MKCPKCGKEVAGNFCPECGQPLNTQPSPAVGAASTPNNPNKRKGKGCLAVVLVVLLFFVIGAALGSQNKNASSKPQSTDSSSQSVASQSELNSSQSVVESQDTVTTGQKNALRSAEQYLSVMPFSYSGLIEQLEYENYSTEDATYAADNCGADWNEQAAKAAKKYLDVMAFSRDGLIEQLIFEGFTQEQAEYGVSQNGY